MALMTKTQIEGICDHLAAMMGDDRDGMRNAATAPDTGSLFALLDAVGNGGIETYLGSEFLALDALRWNESDLFIKVLLAKYGPLLQKMNAQVSAEGTYATFDAYLSGIGAQVSPLLQAVAAQPTAFGGALSPANVWSPEITSSAFDAVYAGTEGSLADETEDAGDAGTADVDVFAANGDALYLRLNQKPTTTYGHVGVQLSTNGSANAAHAFEYWNGTAWATLTTTDGDTTGTYANRGTKGFRQSGVFRYTVPTNWERCSLDPNGDPIFDDDLTAGYYIRIARSAGTLVTAPVVSMLRHGIGLGLVIVTAANTCTFVAGEAIDSTLYDATNQLRLRALTDIGQDVTATLTYTNRDGTAGQSQALSAWTAPLAGDTHSPSSISAGVQAVTGCTVATTATSGCFAIESVPPRTPSK